MNQSRPRLPFPKTIWLAIVRTGRLCLLFLVSYLAASCVTEGKHVTVDDSNLVNVGNKLPDFTVNLSDGTATGTTQLTGKPSVIVLFNTECSDCRRELPVVEKLYKEYAGRVSFLCISRAEGKEEIKKYWTDNGLTLPVAPQDDRQVFSLFALRSIPRIYVSDASLTVRATFAERVNESRLRSSIEDLLH